MEYFNSDIPPRGFIVLIIVYVCVSNEHGKGREGGWFDASALVRENSAIVTNTLLLALTRRGLFALLGLRASFWKTAGT